MPTDTSAYPILDEMMERARSEHLWFYCSYQHLWFSPAELAAHHANGRFRWGPVNWELRSPMERLVELNEEIEKATRARDEFRRHAYPE